jgi:hypothetical protein
MIGPGQRRHARRITDQVIRYAAADGASHYCETARVVDISEGGMCFVGSRYITLGTTLEIEFGKCRLLAEVRHCRLREYGSDNQFVTGVQVRQIMEGAAMWLELTESVE